jgi:hypothetical protein
MGSRPKFWFGRDGARWLFKATRPDQGEDWAEVLAADAAEALGLPHADYQLATFLGQRGVVTPTFQTPGFDLVHGNELLQRVDPTYPPEGMRYVRTRRHTLDAVATALGSLGIGLPTGWAAPVDVSRAEEVFAGYLLLDAWIGNTDRHHENWAVLFSRADVTIHLAPTFDHAASLGSHETDVRARRLSPARDPATAVRSVRSEPLTRSAARRSDPAARPCAPGRGRTRLRRRRRRRPRSRRSPG